MKYIIPDCTDPRLPVAIEEQMVDISRTFESTGYTQVIDTPFMTFTTSKIPHPAFNGVGLTKLTPENSDEHIDKAIKFFEERGTPWLWRTGPLTKPEDLG